INAHPHSGWFCVKHYLISLKRNSIALHGLKQHKQTKNCAVVKRRTIFVFISKIQLNFAIATIFYHLLK
ncbi:hypothetical protein, partial [Phascolarctobacterium succinatutens]|uniref:hypothetical protein n=1 Tax=Phascolarctobacterium succinatutens TaxID=626940 RepID=UPI0026ECE69C